LIKNPGISKFSKKRFPYALHGKNDLGSLFYRGYGGNVVDEL